METPEYVGRRRSISRRCWPAMLISDVVRNIDSEWLDVHDFGSLRSKIIVI
jgi:hypothetical protein